MPVVRAPLRVMTLAPAPPVMVSMLARVAVEALLPSARLSSAGAEIDRMAVAGAAPRVMVSSPVPPATVSTLATVAALVPLARVSVSLPAPRSTRAVGDGGAQGDGVGAGAADQGAGRC